MPQAAACSYPGSPRIWFDCQIARKQKPWAMALWADDTMKYKLRPIKSLKTNKQTKNSNTQCCWVCSETSIFTQSSYGECQSGQSFRKVLKHLGWFHFKESILRKRPEIQHLLSWEEGRQKVCLSSSWILWFIPLGRDTSVPHTGHVWGLAETPEVLFPERGLRNS